jgi:ADP-ribose pyrophosphatase YjhB (NUDIX family)
MGANDEVTDLIRWSEALSAIARTGMGFTTSMFETERFEEILHIAADIKAAVDARLGADGEPNPEEQFVEWLGDVRPGVEGYVTPKVAIGALVTNDAGEILLIKRRDSGAWLYPTGWADVGYAAAEVVVKEIREETGIIAEPVRVAMVLDSLRVTVSRIPLYSIVFLCQATGGTITPHPLECLDAGFFAQDALPDPIAIGGVWVDHAFRIIRGEDTAVYFDWPRTPAWREGNEPG